MASVSAATKVFPTGRNRNPLIWMISYTAEQIFKAECPLAELQSEGVRSISGYRFSVGDAVEVGERSVACTSPAMLEMRPHGLSIREYGPLPAAFPYKTHLVAWDAEKPHEHNINADMDNRTDSRQVRLGGDIQA